VSLPWLLRPCSPLNKKPYQTTNGEDHNGFDRNSHPAANTLIKASKDGKLNLYYLPASDEPSFITT
jgi:hypothetical protein